MAEGRVYKVALDNNADTSNELYNALKNTHGVTIIKISR